MRNVICNPPVKSLRVGNSPIRSFLRVRSRVHYPRNLQLTKKKKKKKKKIFYQTIDDDDSYSSSSCLLTFRHPQWLIRSGSDRIAVNDGFINVAAVTAAANIEIDEVIKVIVNEATMQQCHRQGHQSNRQRDQKQDRQRSH